MSDTPAVTAPIPQDILSVALTKDWGLSVHISPIPLIILLFIVLSIWLGARWIMNKRIPDFEVDSAEVGFGDHKISFKPNNVDRQIAYSIWVELSTRKIGLPINLEDDVISEVYDSWYAFFGVTRELIKSIPVSKVRQDSTGKIIELSVEVLNEGLRPHLTKWQARYRNWYEHQLAKKSDVEPQELQKQFPAYKELTHDLLTMNKKLIAYRTKMNELVRGK
jgi:hypothetical protein